MSQNHNSCSCFVLWKKTLHEFYILPLIVLDSYVVLYVHLLNTDLTYNWFHIWVNTTRYCLVLHCYSELCANNRSSKVCSWLTLYESQWSLWSWRNNHRDRSSGGPRCKLLMLLTISGQWNPIGQLKVASWRNLLDSLSPFFTAHATARLLTYFES